MKLEFTVNGVHHELDVTPLARLLDVLRTELGLTGTKEGCGEGECGACTVILDGAATNACLVPASQAQGCEVVTIEGLVGADGEPSVLQRHFVDDGGVQCGFCTPGMIMAARALLDRTPNPTEEEIRVGLAGNLCRCTGYQGIIASVQGAAQEEAALRSGDASEGGVQ